MWNSQDWYSFFLFSLFTIFLFILFSAYYRAFFSEYLRLATSASSVSMLTKHNSRNTESEYAFNQILQIICMHTKIREVYKSRIAVNFCLGPDVEF
jgi:hypothetical protein